MSSGRKTGAVREVWSQQEIDWLKLNYMNGDIKWMADQLNRPYGGVTHQLYQLRLSSTGRQLKKVVPYKHEYAKKEANSCDLPVFHPVMIGLYPNRLFNGRMWRKRRAIILKMHDNLCVYCGDEAFTVDHVVPVDKGGLDNIENLVAACTKCNSTLGNKTKHILWISRGKTSLHA